MADYILEKRKAFEFALEDAPEKTYSIPALKSLSFEDAQHLTKIDDEKNIVKRGRMIRDFILKFAPDLETMDLGDMEYFGIYNAYGASFNKTEMGESKASADS